MTIICVDDEALVLRLSVTMCKELPQKPGVKGFTDAKEALEYLQRNSADIALLDINMPEMDGIALAARIKERQPDIAIIFLTGHSEYAVDAFALHASGYLLKPITKERLAEEVEYALTGRPAVKKPAHIVARTFGEFDLQVDGKSVAFSRKRAKELLAYLIDRQGGNITRATAFAVLWEDAMYDRPMQKQLDVIIRSLKATLKEYGISEIFEMQGGFMRIVPEKLDCDLYRFFAGDIKAIDSYQGQYMSAYSWGDLTEAYMDHINRRY